jgi:YggT family protein
MVTAFLGLLLTLAQLLLLARVVIDWAMLLAPTAGPSSPVIRIAAVLRRITDPPLAPLRRLLPPVRLGTVGLDLSVTVAFLLLILVRALLGV